MKISERLRTQVRKIKPLIAAVRAIRIAVDPVRRTAWMIGRRSPDLLMQPFPTTSFDRHPGLFGFVKVRYRGLKKNTAQLFTLFALSNLWMVRSKLMGAGA